MENNQTFLTKILAKDSDRQILVGVSKIFWIESSGNYAILHLENTEYIIRSSLKKLLKKLDPQNFIRVHRSSIVNINKVKAIEPWFTGDAHIFLLNGKKIKMSRNYKQALNKFKV
ncbi:LytR/AlgR family response regulator transcription factor [Fodinibius saliphilus]|uniref:LytR/AlgR family response regulator transcription factor n=1 Tax=Fodinibius saliphilus TaxID=1920650 RepID=UPI001109391E|nr:LytTR family DNA-binding domain-containing protein [Fodinibius saliphilus]